MKVGLVLGAGGVLGGAWLVGGLHALAAQTGWDPGSADYIVGTSAGSMIAGLTASGVPPWFMLAHSAGELPALDEVAAGAEASRSGAEASRSGAEASRSAGAVYHLHRSVPVLGPGSWRLALTSLARPYRYSPAAVFAGWLPRGLISAEPLKQTIRNVVADGWAPRPNLWIMACDYANGRRVAFGREDAPPVSLADAVAASCAIPGFYRPVRISGRRYVDGGVASMSNLDVLADRGLDLVICMNPTSSLHAADPRTLGERAAAVLRQASGRRLGYEAKRVRGTGTRVLLIQPTVQDLDAIGTNLMSSKRRHHVIEVAADTVARHLLTPEVRKQLEGLPQGHELLVGPPPAQLGLKRPDFGALARARWRAVGDELQSSTG